MVAAFYIIFLGYKRNDPNYHSERREKSIMSNVAESYVRMFIMSLTEFSVFFEQLEDCEHTVIGKVRDRDTDKETKRRRFHFR